MGVGNWEETDEADEGEKRKQPGLATFSQNATLLLEARTYVNRASNTSSAPLFIHMIHSVFVSDLTSELKKNLLLSWVNTFAVDRFRLETSSPAAAV